MSQDQLGPSIAAIRGMSEDEIVERHDQRTEYFNNDLAIRAALRDELDRRTSTRATRATIRLGKLTVLLSALALVVAIIALVK